MTGRRSSCPRQLPGLFLYFWETGQSAGQEDGVCYRLFAKSWGPDWSRYSTTCCRDIAVYFSCVFCSIFVGWL